MVFVTLNIPTVIFSEAFKCKLKLSKVTWLNVAGTKMFYQLFSVFEFYEIDNPIDLFRNKHKEQGKFEDNLTIVLI